MRRSPHPGFVSIVVSYAVLTLFTGNLLALGDPRYKLKMVTYNSSANPLQVVHRLDIQSASTGAPQPVVGFTFGVCQGSGLAVTSLTLGASVAQLNGGNPPAAAFLNLNPVPGYGFTASVVIDYTGVYHLSPGLDQELLIASYVNPGTTGNLDLWYCTLGTPAVAPHIVEQGGSGMIPRTMPGVAMVGSPPETFVRGDCDRSGGLAIPDVIGILLTVFPPPGASITPPCMDACDADDSGSFSLPDAIMVLNALFAVPVIPLPGPAGCITDPTDNDALNCATPMSCP